ncbi:MAG TPA: ABC transporter permease [Candidatus Hydrogenedentes bacterium]|nr:ABC transporter permease [Candidatus Hydrogenedentota bacterium]HOL75836.1 ABC transporter permease [Candidatus Hydrogenedentota bacterium]HPO86338.1 ABC transporter permease [Candidatus Hydrogenedentota bacterium]
MKRFLAKHTPLVILAVLCLVLAVIFPNFRQTDNVQRLLQRTCVVAIIAVGQTLVIIVGGIDLSVGSVAALGGGAAVWVMNKLGVPVPVGVLTGALVGMVCGALSGLLSTKGRIPSFIATLGMMMIARGAVLLLLRGKPLYDAPKAFRYLGGTQGWWIPIAIAGAIMMVVSITLSMTRFGRELYACGGNLSGARLSGIPVDRVRTLAFLICGMLSGFAGCMLASRTNVAEPMGAQGMELDAIAACVIGGASLMGGEGGAVGSVAGALIMNVLVNICNLTDFDVYWQYVLIGALIIVLVWYDAWRKRRSGLLRD